MARQKYPCKVQRYPEGEMLWEGKCNSGREAMEFADVIEAADDHRGSPRISRGPRTDPDVRVNASGSSLGSRRRA